MRPEKNGFNVFWKLANAMLYMIILQTLKIGQIWYCVLVFVWNLRVLLSQLRICDKTSICVIVGLQINIILYTVYTRWQSEKMYKNITSWALENPHVKELTEPTELQEFHEQYVKQMERARDSAFIEICTSSSRDLIITLSLSLFGRLAKCNQGEAGCLTENCPSPFGSALFSLATESSTSCRRGKDS